MRPFRHLGKRPAKRDPRIPRLASYIPASYPPPPTEADWYSKIPAAGWGMCGNQAAGDCMFAAIAHARLQWTYYASGTGQLPSDAEVLAWYSSVTGYNPADPSSDHGTVMVDALERWLHPGYPVGPDTYEAASAYAAVNPRNWDEVRHAISWFGNLVIGLELPVAWQKPGLWDVGPDGPVGDYTPGSWGGHAIMSPGYSGDVLQVVTWGKLQPITRRAFAEYCDEAYVILNADWKKPPGYTPSGLPWTQLLSDMDRIRSGGGA